MKLGRVLKAMLTPEQSPQDPKCPDCGLPYFPYEEWLELGQRNLKKAENFVFKKRHEYHDERFCPGSPKVQRETRRKQMRDQFEAASGGLLKVGFMTDSNAPDDYTFLVLFGPAVSIFEPKLIAMGFERDPNSRDKCTLSFGKLMTEKRARALLEELMGTDWEEVEQSLGTKL